MDNCVGGFSLQYIFSFLIFIWSNWEDWQFLLSRIELGVQIKKKEKLVRYF